jgi:serine protease
MKAGKAVLSAGACALVLVLMPAMALAAAPNDPLYPQQWALSGSTPSINAAQAWCAGLGGALVADVDTGADFGHADLAGKLIPGARFTNTDGSQVPGGSVQDDYGHGTMTTGIMVADTNNGVGISGVAPAAKALIVKVLDGNGQGYGADVAAGIRYAVDYGAKVINLSIGSDSKPLLGLINLGGPNPILPAIQYAHDHGVAVAAAAGNSAFSSSDYQQVEPISLVVGALGRSGAIASYSTPGNIYATGGDSGNAPRTPDVSITSTALGGGYAAGDGTSFAAPQVAGALALLMAKGYSADGARQQLLATAANRGGLPEMDAAAALGASGAAPCAPGGGGGGGGTPPPVRPASPHPRPAASAQAPAAAPAASPSPSPSPSPQVSPSPSDSAGPTSGTLATRADPPKQRRTIYALLGFTFIAGDSLWLLAVGIVAGMASGYGALLFMKAAGRE